MTTFVEMILLWVLRLLVAAIILFGFFQMEFEFAPMDAVAEMVYEFGTEVPDIVLRHTTQEWRVENNCHVGYFCKGEKAFWER